MVTLNLFSFSNLHTFNLRVLGGDLAAEVYFCSLINLIGGETVKLIDDNGELWMKAVEETAKVGEEIVSQLIG